MESSWNKQFKRNFLIFFFLSSHLTWRSLYIDLREKKKTWSIMIYKKKTKKEFFNATRNKEMKLKISDIVIV
jgi:hypothetical protein